MAAAHRFAEFLRQRRQQALLFQIAAGPGNLVGQNLRVGELLEQRHDIRERLVQRQHVRVRRLGEPRVQPVQNGVTGFVHDDVVGQARENGGARRRGAAFPARREVAEQQRFSCAGRNTRWPRAGHAGRCAGAAAEDILGIAFAGGQVFARCPKHDPAQRLLEQLDGLHGHRIDHLLVKPRVLLGRRKPVVQQHPVVVQVYGFVEHAGGRVVIHHFQVLATRPPEGRVRVRRVELPWQRDHDLADRAVLELVAGSGVEGEDPQPPGRHEGLVVAKHDGHELIPPVKAQAAPAGHPAPARRASGRTARPHRQRHSPH